MTAEDVPADESTAVEPVRRALDITEIVQVIVEACPRSVLAALSRVNQTISDAALDKLWQTQTGLVNLMRCLPPHLRISKLSASVCRLHAVRVLRSNRDPSFVASQLP